MISVSAYQDTFHPVLFNSPAVSLSQEQNTLIRRVLLKTSGDSLLAQKAWNAILYILTQGDTPLPAITELAPQSVLLGSPSFTLSVIGTDFDEGSVIIWNGSPEPTVFVSPTELTTLVNMETAAVAIDIPVEVQNAAGLISNTMIFQILEP